MEETLTDSAGNAATTFTLDRKPGQNTVEVLVAGLLPVTFTARGIGIPQALTKAAGNEQQGPPAGALAQPLVALVQDGYGNPLAGDTVPSRLLPGEGRSLRKRSPPMKAGCGHYLDSERRAREEYRPPPEFPN